MKNFTIITADGAAHIIAAASAEAACVRFDTCGGYPYEAEWLISPEGNRIRLRYGHVPMGR